jgi:hypothetical protein
MAPSKIVKRHLLYLGVTKFGPSNGSELTCPKGFYCNWLKNCKRAEEIVFFPALLVQINAKFQRRGRGMNLIAFRIYFHHVRLG